MLAYEAISKPALHADDLSVSRSFSKSDSPGWLGSSLGLAVDNLPLRRQEQHSPAKMSSNSIPLSRLPSSQKSNPLSSHRLSATTVVPKDIAISRRNSEESDEPRSDSNVYRHARSGRKVIIGPMPVGPFLDEFLPPVPKGKPVPKAADAFTRVPQTPKSGEALCDPLVEAINKAGLCPSISFCNTRGTSEDPFSLDFKPSICGYARRDKRLMTREKQPNLGLAEIFFVVKKDHDPFCDSHLHTESTYESFFSFENRGYEEEEDVEPGRSEKRNLGQCVAHAVEACMRQFRLFYFSVLVIGTRARLFRWDRAGGIVTNAFDYRDFPELLCEFLWRFHHANPVQRGFDPTVSAASQAEEDLFGKLIRQHAALQLGISEDDSKKLDNALSQHYEKGKVTKVAVYERGCLTPDFYLVSVPLTCPKSVSGHSTRAYWSVKLTGRKKGVVYFLKDSWRLDVDSMRSEGGIYEEMEGAKVESICNLETYGDIPDVDAVGKHFEDRRMCHEQNAENGGAATSAQRTRTHEFVEAAWVCSCLRDELDLRVFQHTHSRIVLKQAGYSLRVFTGSRELFGAARDALQALDSAHKRCRRVHRDVSLDNIILFRSEPAGIRKGLLVDWEFSSVVNSSGQVTDKLRSGTWAFMSGNALYGLRSFRHTIEDDLESLFYVLMYGSIRWLPHDYVSQLGSWMRMFFDEARLEGCGETVGGEHKLLGILNSGSKFLDLFSFKNRFVQDWFELGYRLLGTTSEPSKSCGQTCLWTTGKLHELLAIICEGLAGTGDTKCDRTEHPLEGYVDMSASSRDTQISLFAAARNFRISHEEQESRGKRPLAETFVDNNVEANESEHRVLEGRGDKRRRVDSGATPLSEAINDESRPSKRCGPPHETPGDWNASGKLAKVGGPRRPRRRTRPFASRGTRKSPRLEAKHNLLRSASSG